MKWVDRKFAAQCCDIICTEHHLSHVIDRYDCELSTVAGTESPQNYQGAYAMTLTTKRT